MAHSLSLEGKRGLIVGIANKHSIAYGCAEAFKAAGAELALTYLNEKSDQYVRPLADELEASLYLPCDVTKEGELEAVFAEIEEKWGKLDFLLHSIAFAPREDLHARVVDCSQEGFNLAMDVSCHSFIRMANLAEPLMKKAGGGTLMSVTFYGAEKVVENYNLMGPVKAALESATRYMAAELAEDNIRVHAISPGPIATRAASGIGRFDELMQHTMERVPSHHLVSIDDVGAVAAFLASEGGQGITGSIIQVDNGFSIMG